MDALARDDAPGAAAAPAPAAGAGAGASNESPQRSQAGNICRREYSAPVLVPQLSQLSIFGPFAVVDFHGDVHGAGDDVVPVLHPPPQRIPVRAIGYALFKLPAFVHVRVRLGVRPAPRSIHSFTPPFTRKPCFNPQLSRFFIVASSSLAATAV